MPPFISYYRTGERIKRMQAQAGGEPAVSPALGLLAVFVLSLHVVYMQEHLNRVWERAAPQGAAAA